MYFCMHLPVLLRKKIKKIKKDSIRIEVLVRTHLKTKNMKKHVSPYFPDVMSKYIYFC